jgi:hypothetical protein
LVIFHRRTAHAATAMQDRSGPGIAGFGLKKENNLSVLNTFGKTGKSIFRGFHSGTNYKNRSGLKTAKRYCPESSSLLMRS